MVEKQQVMKCCVHLWRILFIILNALFLVIGLALVGLAIYLLASQNDLTFLTGSRIGSGAVLILIAGLVTTVISMLGVLGAIGMWPVLLIIYIVLLFFIVVLEIVAGVLGFVYKSELVDVAEVRAADAIEQYLPEDVEGVEVREDVNSIVDFLQEQFECCGFSSSDDWLVTNYYVNFTQEYPGSCNCTDDTEDVMMSRCEDVGNQTIYIASCNESLSDFLSENLAIVGGVGIAFGLFEVIGIGVAIALTCCFCAIRRNKDDYEFTKAV